MKRIHLANVLLICVLGTLLLWPNIKEPIIHRSVSTAYDSICMISSDALLGNQFFASGVLLESGYIITAAHVVDRNMDGVIDDNERFVDIKFPALGEEVFLAETIAVSKTPGTLDVAILNPTEAIWLPGVKLTSDEEYWSTKIGAPLYTIGMQNGDYPGNITDGRMIEMKPSSNSHRNSANSYFGNSGGGVFIDNKLIGIASAVGIGRQRLQVPIFSGMRQVGVAIVPYSVPLANSSLHVPAPSIRQFLVENDLEEALWEAPTRCPYEAYFAVALFNLILAAWLFLIFKLMRRWMSKDD